jgi:hypothetical protein
LLADAGWFEKAGHGTLARHGSVSLVTRRVHAKELDILDAVLRLLSGIRVRKAQWDGKKPTRAIVPRVWEVQSTALGLGNPNSADNDSERLRGRGRREVLSSIPMLESIDLKPAVAFWKSIKKK